MYSSLGDIVFQGLIGFNAFEHTKEANIVEHDLIDGKPRLQRVGTNLDKIRIEIMFHVSFCDPEAQLRALDNARENGDVLPFVLGNGSNLGDYVIKSTTQTNKQTDQRGGLREVSVSVELVEHVEPNALVAAAQAAIGGAFANASNKPAQVSLSTATALQSASDATLATSLVVATASRAQGVNETLRKITQFPAQANYQMAVVNAHSQSMKRNIEALQELVTKPSLQGVTQALAAHLPSLLTTVNAVSTQSGNGNLAGVTAVNDVMQSQVVTMRTLSNGLSILKASR